MGLGSWILVGVLVGLAAQRLRPGTFPLRAPGTVLAGVLGATLGLVVAGAVADATDGSWVRHR